MRTGTADSRRWHRAASAVRDNLWFVPALYVAGALALSVGLVHWDESDPIDLVHSINSSSASAALSALGSGMLAFTGFVTSVILLVVQFGTSEFSPRFVAWIRRDATLKYALSTFSATFLFALVSTAQVGRGTAAFVPTRTLIAALLLTLLSIAMFLVLIERSSNGLRVASVVQEVDVEAREVFDAVYPASPAEAAAAQQTTRSLNELTPVQTIRQGQVGSVVVALNRTGIANLAEQYDAVIELVPAIGDHVPAGGALLNVYGPRQLPERRLRRAVLLGDERTIDDDPAFAIRMLVDVAIKALWGIHLTGLETAAGFRRSATGGPPLGARGSEGVPCRPRLASHGVAFCWRADPRTGPARGRRLAAGPGRTPCPGWPIGGG